MNLNFIQPNKSFKRTPLRGAALIPTLSTLRLNVRPLFFHFKI
jgi:hypothetical protein